MSKSGGSAPRSKAAESTDGITQKDDGSFVIDLHKPKDPPKFKAFGGSNFDNWNQNIAQQITNVMHRSDKTPETVKRLADLGTSLLLGLEPKDEIEGMLIAQMAAMHFATMEASRLAMINQGHLDAHKTFTMGAAKCSRSFVALTEALDKHRGKGGQQKVTVEHVHVHNGGQAIVGNVTPGGGPGVHQKGDVQAHASQVTYAPVVPMPREDPEGDPVPESSRQGKA